MTTHTHIMLDLETWGKIPGSDIRSIGATVFDPVAGTVGMICETCRNGCSDPWGCTDCLNKGTDSRGEFYMPTVNPQRVIAGFFDGIDTRRAYNLTRDPETVAWWNEQSPEAQNAFSHPIDLREACGNFFEWFTGFDNGNSQREGTTIWCNDPHFDVAILSAVFRAVGLDEPWHYRAPRSFRTIVEAAGMNRDDFKPFSHGTAHNALDDAISQAYIVCEAYRRLGLKK